MKKKPYLTIFILVICIILLIFFWKSLFSFFTDAEKVRSTINDFGVFGPLVFILLQILQVIAAPIPGQASGFVGGYVFGYWGILYTMIGLIIGSYVVFVLSRKFGRPLVESFVNQKTLNKFDYLAKEKGVFTFFLIYLLPALPDDIISFIAGLTKIRIRTLILIAFLGRFPGMVVLTLVGNGVATANSVTSLIIFVVLMVVSLIIYLKKDKIERLMIKIIKKRGR